MDYEAIKDLVLKNLVFVLLCSTTLAQTQPETDWLKSSELTCRKSVEKLDAADLWIGGAIGLYDNGKTFEETFGEQTPNSKITVPLNSFFEIGSVSKSFTGILLVLATLEVKEIKLTDKLSKFFPEIKNKYVSEVNLQQLATHSAGFEDNPNDLAAQPNFDPSNSLGNYTENQLITYLQTASPVPALILPNNPGLYTRAYSNIGFAVLGLALTRIYHLDFDSLLKKKITHPLGMFHTFVNRRGQVLPDLMNKPYGIGKNVVSPMTLDIFAPAGAIVSTLPEMMEYLRANIEGGENDLAKAIQMSHQLGLGWDSFPGDQVIMKNGQTQGFSTFISFDPLTKRGSIELHNMYSVMSDWVAALPITTLAPKTDQISISFSELVFDIVTNPVSETMIRSAAGNYVKTSGPGEIRSITLTGQNKNLIVTVDGEIVGVILGLTGRKMPYILFQGSVSLGTLEFSKNASENVTGMTFAETDQSGKPLGIYTFVKH